MSDPCHTPGSPCSARLQRHNHAHKPGDRVGTNRIWVSQLSAPTRSLPNTSKRDNMVDIASLHALVEQWRDKAGAAEHYAHYQIAADLRACADQLEAQL